MYDIRYRIERDFYGYDEHVGDYGDFLGDDVVDNGLLQFTEEQWTSDGVGSRLFMLMLKHVPFMKAPLFRHMSTFEWYVYEMRSGKVYEYSDECEENDTIHMVVDYTMFLDVWKDGIPLGDGGSLALHELGLEKSGLVETDDTDEMYEIT